MLAYFPTPYPDELLYSAIARLSLYMDYSNQRQLISTLFGSSNLRSVVDLPCHLDHIVSAMPRGHPYTSDHIIDHHTVFPFYSPFLPPKRRRQLRVDMQNGSGGTIHMRAGIMASKAPSPNFLRFCPECVKTDRETLDETYWHRVHQLPGISVCPVHQHHLVNSRVRTRSPRIIYQFVSAEQAIEQAQRNPKMGIEADPKLNTLAHNADWLLRHPNLNPNEGFAAQRYQNLLYDCGLASRSGRVQVRDLLHEFYTYYSSSLLNRLGCEMDPVAENWLVRIVRNSSGAQHPLYHLLLITFLNCPIDKFFTAPGPSKSFGSPPWPCLNPTCAHYREMSITECDIRHSRYVDGHPIGMFTCPTCGFSYTRTGPDTTSDDRFTYTNVSSYGPVWLSALRRWWHDPTVSLREMGRRLSVDPKTVKRYARIHNLVSPRPGGVTVNPYGHTSSDSVTSTDQKAYADSDRKRYRKLWLDVTRTDEGVNAAREKAPGAYAWLYRHDRKWLNAHKPTPRRVTSRPSRIDWHARDRKIAADISASVERLKAASGRPKQITVTAVGREMGLIHLLQQHLDKLPLTKRVLDELVESRLDYALRRVQWVERHYREADVHPKRWQYERRAGIARIAHWNVVAAAVDAALERLCEPDNGASNDV